MHIVRYRCAWSYIEGFNNLLNLGGSVDVVEQAGHSVKSNSSEELLIIQTIVLFAEGGMAFMGNFTEFMV